MNNEQFIRWIGGILGHGLSALQEHAGQLNAEDLQLLRTKLREYNVRTEVINAIDLMVNHIWDEEA